MVMNCLKTIDKKVDNPENQSWVNIKFEKFACHEVWHGYYIIVVILI